MECIRKLVSHPLTHQQTFIDPCDIPAPMPSARNTEISKTQSLPKGLIFSLGAIDI